MATREKLDKKIQQLKRSRNKKEEDSVLDIKDMRERFQKGIEVPLGLSTLLTMNVLPLDCMVEIFGKPGTGKSTLALKMGEWFIKQGGMVFYVNCESLNKMPLDPLMYWYSSLINVEESNQFIHTSPSIASEAAQDINDALDIMRDLNVEAEKVKDGRTKKGFREVYKQVAPEEQVPGLIILDSLPASITDREQKDGAMDYSSSSAIGKYANAWGDPIRKFTGLLQKSNTTIIFINHQRENISINAFEGHKKTGDSNPGGTHVRHMFNMRLALAQTKEEIAGITGEKTLKGRLIKLSGGSDDRRLENIKYRWEGRKFFEYEFSTALGHLLVSEFTSKKDLVLAGLEDLSSTGNKFKSKSLDLSNVTGVELEEAIQDKPEIVEAIQEHFEVIKRPTFSTVANNANTEE